MEVAKNANSKHLPEHFGFKEGAEDFPIMVVLSVTFVCNSKCPSCPYTNSSIREDYKDAPFISPALFKKIADECGPFGSYIRLTGGGEPLLHPNMVELIEYAKAKGAKIGLINNGSCMTEETAKRLLACETDMIEFSVDAADKETYDKVRTGLDFDKLVANVKRTVALRNEMKSPTKIIVSVVNQAIVRDKIDEIVKFWEAIVDKVQVRKYLTWGINDPEQSADKSEYIEAHKIPCPFPFERLNVDSRGKVMFCGYDIAANTDFGNLNTQTIQEVWKSDKYNAWRKLHLEGRGDEIEMCKQCPDWKYRSWNYNYWKIVADADEQRKKAVGDK
jgi:radical SAM protein with 4Fe4S-binding SPASM domain